MEISPSDLVEDGIGEVRIDGDRVRRVALGVVELDRLLDRLPGSVTGQVLQMQIVVVDVVDPACEEVAEPAVGVLPDGDQEVRRYLGGVDAIRQLVGEAIRLAVGQAVAEVLLELIQDDQKRCVERLRGGGDRGREARSGSGRGRPRARLTGRCRPVA